MKKILLTLFVLAASINLSSAKSGGWFKDVFCNNNPVVVSTCYGNGYYNNSYYVERPTYYYPAPVIYERPTYYRQPPVVPMQPYQNHYRSQCYYYGR